MLLLILLATLTLLYVIYLKTNHVRKLAADLPGEVTLPLIGNMHQLGLSVPGMFREMMYMYKKYNYDLYKLYVGPVLYVIITNPDDVALITTNTTNFDKPLVYKLLDKWLGEGLLTSNGKKWFNSRKIITPTFHFKILETFFEIMDKEGEKLVSKMESLADGNVVNVSDVVGGCVLDIISETAMGVSLNAQGNSKSDIVKAIDVMCETTVQRFLNPLKQSDFIYKFFPDYGRYNKALETVKKFNENVIMNRKTYLEKKLKSDENLNKNVNSTSIYKKRFAFLDALITANVEGKPLTNEEISDEVSTFIFTGHDTITSALSFALYNLANNPEIQSKVLQEQIDILGEDLKRKATFQEIQNMSYLNLFIKESLRLHPSAPVIGRSVQEDIDINGRLIPAGCTIFIFIYAMHRNPRIFPNPDKFDPERFLPENRLNRHPYEYIPFSAGQRNCVGQKFAMQEMKLILSKLVRQYEFTSAGPENEAKLFTAMTLRSENGVLMRIRPRKY